MSQYAAEDYCFPRRIVSRTNMGYQRNDPVVEAKRGTVTTVSALTRTVSPDTPSDGVLVRRIAEGDHGAFALLVERYSRKYYQVAYRVVLSRSDAEDVVQNAFLKLWQKAALWDEREASFRTWFHRIVTNQAIDWVRQRRTVTMGDDFPDVADDRPQADAQVARSQTSKVMWSMIAELPESQRVALNLCHFEGFSNKEAAEILGLNVKALESLLVRARKGLLARMQKQGLTKDSL